MSNASPQHAIAIVGQGQRPAPTRHMTLPRLSPTTDELFAERELLTDRLFRLDFYKPHIIAERGQHLDDLMEDYMDGLDQLPPRLVVDVTAVSDSEYDRQWTPELFAFESWSAELIEYHRRPDDKRRIAVFHVQAK